MRLDAWLVASFVLLDAWLVASSLLSVACSRTSGPAPGGEVRESSEKSASAAQQTPTANTKKQESATLSERPDPIELNEAEDETPNPPPEPPEAMRELLERVSEDPSFPCERSYMQTKRALAVSPPDGLSVGGDAARTLPEERITSLAVRAGAPRRATTTIRSAPLPSPMVACRRSRSCHCPDKTTTTALRLGRCVLLLSHSGDYPGALSLRPPSRRLAHDLRDGERGIRADVRVFVRHQTPARCSVDARLSQLLPLAFCVRAPRCTPLRNANILAAHIASDHDSNPFRVASSPRHR